MNLEPSTKANVSPSLRKELNHAWQAIRALVPTASDNQTITRHSGGFSIVQRHKFAPTSGEYGGAGDLAWGDTMDGRAEVYPASGGPWLWKANRLGVYNGATGAYDEPATTGWSHHTGSEPYESAHYHYLLPPPINIRALSIAKRIWAKELLESNTAEICGKFFPVWGHEYLNVRDNFLPNPRVMAPSRWNYNGRPQAFFISRMPQALKLDLLGRPSWHPDHSGATVLVEWCVAEEPPIGDHAGFMGALKYFGGGTPSSLYAGIIYPYSIMTPPTILQDNEHSQHWVAADASGVLGT